jgi:hypothetical protein
VCRNGADANFRLHPALPASRIDSAGPRFFNHAMRIAVLALVLGLAACGGGDDARPSLTLTVSAATLASDNGDYVARPIQAEDVGNFNLLDPSQDLCRFNFTGFRREGPAGELHGTIVYAPASATGAAAQLRTTLLVINGTEYLLAGDTGAALDGPVRRVIYSGAVLTGVTSGRQVTVNGTVAIPSNRPPEC